MFSETMVLFGYVAITFPFNAQQALGRFLYYVS